MQLPEAFTQQMKELIGTEDFLRLSASLESDAAVAFRPNGRKGFCAVGDLQPVPWSSLGYYLSERLPFTFDPLLHAGAYYVQEPSSMFIEQAVRQCEPVAMRVLDLCAAPGGKSTLLRSLLPDESVLVVNEPVRQRAQVLMENMTKWGHPSVVVTNASPAAFASLEGFFNLMLIDAPCSGEGMFRKDNPALSEWSVQNVEHCAARQFQIVSDAWPALAEGGYLIYSTCTYNLRENELQVQRICSELGASCMEIPTDPAWGIVGSLLQGENLPVCRFMPHKLRGEGLFVALLRKERSVRAPKQRGGGQRVLPLDRQLRPWLQNADGWGQISIGETLYALPPALAEVVSLFLPRLAVLSAGVALAQRKGGAYQPEHGLSQSLAFRRDHFPTVNLTYEDAIAYLRRQSLSLGNDVPRGMVVVMYGGVSLGFVNQLGDRANNLYPQPWKIRSQNAAPEVFSIVNRDAEWA